MEILEHLFTAGGNVKWYSCYGKHYGGSSKKLKLLELLHGLANPFLGIYQKELKAESQRDICTLMFLATLFTIAKKWKRWKCPSVDEWINKMWCIHPVEYYSTMNRKKF